MKIKIEQSHIEEGLANMENDLDMIEYDPIGIALTQLGLLDVKVWGGGGAEYLNAKTGKLEGFDFPSEVVGFMEAFDDERRVEPFEFEIPLEMEDVKKARGNQI